MKNIIIGTIGHVDHGKTTLTAAIKNMGLYSLRYLYAQSWLIYRLTSRRLGVRRGKTHTITTLKTKLYDTKHTSN